MKKTRQFKTHKKTHPLVESILSCIASFDPVDNKVRIDWMLTPEQYVSILVGGGMSQGEAMAQLQSLPTEDF